MMSVKTRNDVMNHLQKVFGMPENADADFDLGLQPMKEDCEGADPKNPFNCVLVHTARRQFGSKAAIFWKYYAYLDLLDGKTGIRRVYRFKVTAAAYQHIHNLDTGKPFREGTAITLKAIAGGDKRSVRRKNAKAYHATPEGKMTGRLAAARTRKRKAEGDLERTKARVERLAETEKPRSPKLKEARQQVVVANTALNRALNDITKAEERVDEFRRTSGKSRPRRNHVFDLTTRNGAAGHYNIQAA
jgi:hypothetical protein